jgi:hypothetical protein
LRFDDALAKYPQQSADPRSAGAAGLNAILIRIAAETSAPENEGGATVDAG